MVAPLADTLQTLIIVGGFILLAMSDIFTK